MKVIVVTIMHALLLSGCMHSYHVRVISESSSSKNHCLKDGKIVCD